MPAVYCDIDSPHPNLPEGVAHVYISMLGDGDGNRFFPLLTDDERTRSAKFRIPRIREQFVVARGRLRFLLGHYLGLPPLAVPILYTDSGKPHLPPGFPLHFNVSHTDGLAAFAFGRSRVGVDVERDRPMPDAAALVARFFSRREGEGFGSVPAVEYSAAFFRAWTRKEAVLKAIGRGVQSLDCCDVTFGQHDPVQLLRLDEDHAAGDKWRMFAWEPAAGYIAAGVIEVRTSSEERIE